MTRLLAVWAGWLFVLAPAFAQSPGPQDEVVIDQILASPAVTWSQAAWLVGRSQNTWDEGTPPSDAGNQALKAGWGTPALTGDTLIDTQTFSWLLMRALDLPGGLLYHLFPGPRYAFRELVYRRVLPANLAPDGQLPGEAALRYLQAAQDLKGAL